MTARRYDDIKDNNLKNIENLKNAKDLCNDFYGSISIHAKKVKFANYTKINWKTFTFDLKEVLKFIKEKDMESLNYYVDDFYDAILRGNMICFKNEYKIKSLEDINSLNRFIDNIVEKLHDIKSTLEKNTKLAMDQNEKLFEIINEVNNCSLLEMRKKLNDLELFEKIEEESFKYLKIREDFTYHGYVFENKISVDYSKDVFKNLQLDQKTNLTNDEKIALNLYKTQMYRAFNRVIRYQRETGIEYDENVQRYIDSSWLELKKQNEEYFNSEDAKFARFIYRGGQNDLTIGEKFLNKYPNSLPSKNEYSELILKYLPHILSALNKVTLTEDIVVYRGTSGNSELTDCALLSTSLDREQAKVFIDARYKGDNRIGNLYKILIPKGSPVIGFTTELLSGNLGEHPMGDEQREILIDTSLFDFKSIGYISESDGLKPISFETYIAKPKTFDLEEIKQK